MTSVETAILALKSLSVDHEVPLLVVFQMPPPTLPAYHVDVVVGSMTMERTRPPTLLGPREVQLPLVIPAEGGGVKNRAWLARIASAWALARITALGGILPFSSTMRIRRHARASAG